MGRAKRTSRQLTTAGIRIAALRSINLKLDLGGGMTAAAYQKAIDETTARLSEYNAALSAADQALNHLVESEKRLSDWSERMLAGVAAKWGKDSHEYEMAGGTRKSERKRPMRKAKPTP